MRATAFAFALGLSLVPALASAQIFQPGTQPVGAPMGAIGTLVQSSGPCRTCHANYDDTDDYEPWEAWRGSLMASAARDPVARAAIAIADADVTDASDFCVRCHSPVAWLRGRSEVPDYDTAMMMPRFTADDPRRQPSDDLDGVACMVCHRATDPTDANLFNARLVLADGVLGDTRYGPYAYMAGTEAGHDTGMSGFQSEARLCGMCHDITNPLSMGHRAETSGLVDTGRNFAIERTFSEWRASAFNGRETCQECHMPVVDHPVEAAHFGSFPVTLRDSMNRHDLLGAASWQLRAIAETIPDMSSTVAVHLVDNADRIDAFMQTAATVEILASALVGGSATASVRVTNLTGHKLPTGYPEGRRMWLEIDIVDSTGAITGGSARFDAATGVLEMDPQARTYESSLGIAQPDGTVMPTFHFVENDTLILDTRIPPEGFAPAATDDMAPLGRDYLDPSTGAYRNFDEVSYSFTALCGTGTLTLRARLRYQATTREYVEFLRDTAPDSLDPAMAGRSWGDVAYDAWTMHGGSTPIEMAMAEVALGAAPMACPEPPDAGVDAAMVDAGAPIDGGGSGIDGGGVDAGTTMPPMMGSCGCRAGTRGRGGVPALGVALALFVLARRARRRT